MPRTEQSLCFHPIHQNGTMKGSEMIDNPKKKIALACSQLASVLALNSPATLIYQVVTMRSHSATEPPAAPFTPSQRPAGEFCFSTFGVTR